MKTIISSLLLALLASNVVAQDAPKSSKTYTYTYHCDKQTGCPTPPTPPAPPAPPALPALPAIPAPPAPPAAPVIPAEAHALCQGKAEGARLSYTPRPGAIMQGECVKSHGKMQFSLYHYVEQN